MLSFFRFSPPVRPVEAVPASNLTTISRLPRHNFFAGALSMLGLVTLSLHISQAQSNASLQMVLGNPSGATTSVSNTTNYLMQKAQFAMSYNKTKADPNWVSWHLGPLDLGSASRSDAFHPDTSLPSGWYEVTTGDYTNSGYDRGHNCPSADRTDNDTDNYATFLTDNIVPQTPDNNQGPWEKLETYCRTLVTQGNQLYVITCANGGTGATIAGGKIVVPGYMSKVIVVFPSGVPFSASSVTTSTRVICVDMPNVAGIRNNDWKSYRISVDQLESYTGYNFLSSVSTSVQSVIEARVDNG